jgi:hypothetical protein
VTRRCGYFRKRGERQPVPDLSMAPGHEGHVAFLEERRSLDGRRRVRKSRQGHVDVAAVESVREVAPVHCPDDQD